MVKSIFCCSHTVFLSQLLFFFFLGCPRVEQTYNSRLPTDEFNTATKFSRAQLMLVTLCNVNSHCIKYHRTDDDVFFCFFFHLQIIRKERVLYVQTSNCVEEKEWVDLLSKICQSNAARLECFHPSAYISGMWTW